MEIYLSLSLRCYLYFSSVCCLRLSVWDHLLPPLDLWCSHKVVCYSTNLSIQLSILYINQTQEQLPSDRLVTIALTISNF